MELGEIGQQHAGSALDGDSWLSAVDRKTAVEHALQVARSARGRGQQEHAVRAIDQQLRSGTWRQPRLWAERVSLMSAPGDYAAIRDLWLQSPRRTHSSVSILRTVARAAAVAGEHDEARVLLRKALREQDRRMRRPRAVLQRKRRDLGERIPSRAAASDNSAGPFEQSAAIALSEFDRTASALGVQAYLISGTLLGLLRDGGFISWDKDIDVGIDEALVDMSELVDVFERDPSFLVKRLDFNSDRLRINHIGGAAIDIFPHYRDERDPGRVWHDGSATRWWNSSFDVVQREFLGRSVWVPADPERYLDENYGDWRTPDPVFDARLDAPNVEVTDQEYFDTLLYFSLLTAIRQGKAAKRDRYAALLRELGEGSWVELVGR